MDITASSCINIVVWGENMEVATKLAENLIGVQESNYSWSANYQGSTIKAFIRHPESSISGSPVGVTDILIVHLSGIGSSFLEQAKTYINLRKGIPFKFITSEENLSEWAKQNDCEFINYSLINTEETKNKLVLSVRHLEDTLRTAFEKLDLNKNGLITAEELVQASKTLDHEISLDEAKTVTSTLSHDGNIRFDQFKRWWIMGRGDFNTFRKIVQVEMSVGNFIKRGSQTFNEYIDKLKTEANVNFNSFYQGRINISPTTDLDNGIGITFDLATGKDAEFIYDSLPNYYRSSPLVVGIEIQVDEDIQGAMILQEIDGFKAMIINIFKLNQLLEEGMKVESRHIGKSVFIEFSFFGSIANKINESSFKFNVEAFNFWGAGAIHMFSALTPNDILNSTLEQIIEKISNFKIISHGEFSNFEIFFSALLSAYEDSLKKIFKGNSISFLNFFKALRYLGYELRYDSGELSDLIKELIGANIVESLGTQLSQYQQMSGTMIEQFKPMIENFLGPFKEPLKMVNIDKISVITSSPKLKIFYKTSFHFPGLTAFVRENIL